MKISNQIVRYTCCIAPKRVVGPVSEANALPLDQAMKIRFRFCVFHI